MSRSADRLGWLRLLWGVFTIAQFPWKEPSQAYSCLPVGIITTDCRSLYDLVSRTAMPHCEEYRTTLEVLLIREQCQDHCIFQMDPNDHHAGRCTDQGNGPISPKNCTPEGDVLLV